MQEQTGALHAEQMGQLGEVGAKTSSVIELGNQAAVGDGWAFPSQIGGWTSSDHLFQCREPVLDELTGPLCAGTTRELGHAAECLEVLERLNTGIDGLCQLPGPGLFPGVGRNQSGPLDGAVDPPQDREALAQLTGLPLLVPVKDWNLSEWVPCEVLGKLLTARLEIDGYLLDGDALDRQSDPNAPGGR